MEERQVDVAIIGSGSAGLYAMGRVRPSGKSVILINGGELGTTCARVGCMPSKAIIQVAEDFHRRGVFKRFGLEGHENLSLDVEEALGYVQDLRDMFVERVISNSTDKMPEDMFLPGYAKFIEPGLLEMDNGQRIRAGKVVRRQKAEDSARRELSGQLHHAARLASVMERLSSTSASTPASSPNSSALWA